MAETVPLPQATFQQDVQEHSGGFIVLGIILVVLGFLAIVAPFWAGVFASYFIGGIIAAAGIVRMVAAFGAHSFGAGIFGFGLGGLALVVGFFMIANPGVTLVTLTLLLAGYFIVHGVMEIFLSLHSRGRGWGWILASGIIGVVLGILLWAGFPGTALWAVGTLLGVQLIVSGSAIIGLSSTARGGPPATGRAAV